MELTITEITKMSGTSRCVASWDKRNKKYVRPLPNGENWTEELILRHKLQVGSVITCSAIKTVSNGGPHDNEDMFIDAASIQNTQSLHSDWFGSEAPTSHQTLAEAFNGELTRYGEFQDVFKCYIRRDANSPSLNAVTTKASNLSFVKDSWQDGPYKPYAVLNDGEHKYRLPITSIELFDVWNESGLDGLNELLAGADKVHIRLGLSRPFADSPDRCNMQLNGIILGD